MAASSQYDTVIAPLVLDRSHDAPRVLANLHRVLRPGGTLIMYERVYLGPAGLLSSLWRRIFPGRSVFHLRCVGVMGPQVLLFGASSLRDCCPQRFLLRCASLPSSPKKEEKGPEKEKGKGKDLHTSYTHPLTYRSTHTTTTTTRFAR